MTWAELVAAGANLSVIGLLIYSWRTHLAEMRRDRDYWRSIALRSIRAAELIANPNEADADEAT